MHLRAVLGLYWLQIELNLSNANYFHAIYLKLCNSTTYLAFHL